MHENSRTGENIAQERRSSVTGLATIYRRKSCHWKEINAVSVETTARCPTLSFSKGYKPKQQAGWGAYLQQWSLGPEERGR